MVQPSPVGAGLCQGVARMTLFGFSFVIHKERALRPALPLAVRGLHLFPYVMTPFFLRFVGSSVLSRLLAAVLGGYLLASALAVFLATVLSEPRAESVLAGMLWSFPAYLLAVIWAFSPVSPGRVWLGLLLPSVVLAGASAWLAGGA